jgi:hypothetical protein
MIVPMPSLTAFALALAACAAPRTKPTAPPAAEAVDQPGASATPQLSAAPLVCPDGASPREQTPEPTGG